MGCKIPLCRVLNPVREILMITDSILKYTREYPLSDLHIHTDKPFAIRVNGSIESFEDDLVNREDIEEFIDAFLRSELADTFAEYSDVDLVVEIEEFRFRANIYNTAKGPAVALRKIESEIPTLEMINLPSAARQKLDSRNGLILVTGPTGSGKSTTLAAMINKINDEKNDHIITIEDPIEYIHEDHKCIISQREVGRDAHSFAHALRAALREDPDVILVGELRDLETIQLALTAAETGHLVFGTLHTSGAPNTINRIIDACPPQQQDQVRAQLSQSLVMVITQVLLNRTDGSGRVAAFEVMITNAAVKNLIRENKVFQITSIMQTALAEGMMTMDRAIGDLVQSEVATHER